MVLTITPRFLKIMKHRYFSSLSIFLLALLLTFVPAISLGEDEEAAAQEETAAPSVPEQEEVSLESKIGTSLQEISDLDKQVKKTAKLYLESEGEEREQAWASMHKLETAIDEELDRIVSYFIEMQEKGLDTASYKSDIEKVLVDDQALLMKEIDEVTAKLRELSKERESADAKEQVRILRDAEEASSSLGVMFNAVLNNAKRKESVGLDTTQDLEQLDALLEQYADDLSTRLSLLNKEKDAAQIAYNRAAEGEKEAMKAELDGVKYRHDLVASSLETNLDTMKKRGLETAEYSKLLITSTGKITEDIFQEGVAVSLFSEWWQQSRGWILENGASLVFQLIIIILILIAFRFLAALVSKVITRGLDKSKLQVSHLFREFAISTSRKAVMLLGILVVLSQIGIDVGPMLAGLGVAGFVIGFALKDTLSNFASGMMILVYRPFDVGDAVEVDGVVGKVQAMTLVSTTVLTFDNQQLMIPNNNIWGNTIKNITARKVRRVDMTFGIGYGDDIEKAEAILWKIVKEHPLVLEDPEPVIKLSALGASSVDFVVRPWSNTADYWNVYWDITRSVKMEFDKAGVSIPFPQSDVHLYHHGREGDETKAVVKE